MKRFSSVSPESEAIIQAQETYAYEPHGERSRSSIPYSKVPQVKFLAKKANDTWQLLPSKANGMGPSLHIRKSCGYMVSSMQEVKYVARVFVNIAKKWPTLCFWHPPCNQPSYQPTPLLLHYGKNPALKSSVPHPNAYKHENWGYAQIKTIL